MVSIQELKRIREREAKKLLAENKLLSERRKIENDIIRIRKSRLRDKSERQEKAKIALQNIGKKGLKVGKKIISYLQDLRGY